MTKVEVTIMNQDEMDRLQAKTPEHRLLSMLQQDFNFAPKIAQAILAEAQACLSGPSLSLRAGQMRVILLKRDAPHGQALSQNRTVEVVWTIDAGAEDQEVLVSHGLPALRQVRLQRLLDEALAQGAVASQEDLARGLQVSVRTIKRDCAALQAQGIYLPSRGNLQGIGRGQTHKAQIVGRWLRGETYDQIARHTHHAVSCVRRYVQTFVRVVNLQQQGFSQTEMGLLLQVSQPLLSEYLTVYKQHDSPFCRQRLQEQLTRLTGPAPQAQKGGL
jgi:biotin operon repressor